MPNVLVIPYSCHNLTGQCLKSSSSGEHASSTSEPSSSAEQSSSSATTSQQEEQDEEEVNTTEQAGPSQPRTDADHQRNTSANAPCAKKRQHQGKGHHLYSIDSPVHGLYKKCLIGADILFNELMT